MSSSGLGIWDRQNQPANAGNGDQFGLRAFTFPSVPATSPPRVTEDWKSLQPGLMRVQAISRAVSSEKVPTAASYTPSVATTDEGFSPMPQFGLGAAQSFFPGYSLSSQPAPSNAPQLVRVGSFAPSATGPGGRRRSLSIYSMDSSMTPLPGGFATPMDGVGYRPTMDRVSSFVEPSPIPSLMLDEPPTALEARSTTRGGIVETNAGMDLPASLWMARPSIAPPLPSPDEGDTTPKNLAPLPLQPVLDQPLPPPKPIQPLSIVKKGAPSPVVPQGGKRRQSKAGGHRKTFSASSILSSGTLRAARRLSLTLRTSISAERKPSTVPTAIVAATLAVSPRPMSVNAFSPPRGAGSSVPAAVTPSPPVPASYGHETPPTTKRSLGAMRISDPKLIPIPPVLERTQTARSLPPRFAREYVPTTGLGRTQSRLKKLPPPSPAASRHHPHQPYPQHHRQDPRYYQPHPHHRYESRPHQPQYHHRQREPSKPPSRKPSANRFVIDLHGVRSRSKPAAPPASRRAPSRSSDNKKTAPFVAVGSKSTKKQQAKGKGLSWGKLFTVGGFRKSATTAHKRSSSAAFGGIGIVSGDSAGSSTRPSANRSAARPVSVVSRKPVPTDLLPQNDPEPEEGQGSPEYDFLAYYENNSSPEPGADEAGDLGDDEGDDEAAASVGSGGDGATNFTSEMRRLSTFQRSPRCFEGPSKTFSDVDDAAAASARSASPARSRGSSRDAKLKLSKSAVGPSLARTSISLPSRAAPEPVPAVSHAATDFGRDVYHVPIRPPLTPVDSFKKPSRMTARPGIAAARRTPLLHGSSPPHARHCSPCPSTPTQRHHGGGFGGLGRVDFHYPSGSRQSAPSPDVTPLAAPSGMVQQATYFASAARPSPVPTVESSYSPLPPMPPQLAPVESRNAFDLGERPFASAPQPVKVGGGFISPFANYSLAGRPAQAHSDSFSFNRATVRVR